jgi:hypothetical protein
MRRSVWSGAFLLVVMAASGCAPLLSPYAAGYRRYPVAPPAAVAIDPDRAARGRWDAVMRLPAGTVVDVLSQDGEVRVGALTAVDRSSVRLSVRGIEEKVGRGDVLRVDLVDLPGSEVAAVAKGAGVGAALGIGAAALVSVVIGGGAWPPPGALLRGGAAIGGVAGGQAELIARQRRLVYLAEDQGRPPVRVAPPRSDSMFGMRVVRAYAASEWMDLLELPTGMTLRVVRADGARNVGRLVGVDDEAIRIEYEGAELRIARAAIVRVELLEVG